MLLVVLCGGVIGGSWYFSDQLLAVSHGPDAYNVTVVARSGSTVRLSHSGGIADGGEFGLQWPHGETIVGAAIRTSGSTVTRRLLEPAPSLRAGDHVRYSVYVYRTPSDVHIPYRSVTYPDSLGPMPAWLIAGRSSTWVIAVHGLASKRAEAIREMGALRGLGLPILDIEYRNDAGAPQSPDHLYHLGATEWIDLQSAVQYALRRGARHVVLYGYSMGGNIVETFMEKSSLAARVRAVVLDAPALDWYQILELASEQRDLPGVFAAVVERVVAWRLGMFSLDSIDHLITGKPVRRPTLLFQGSADTLVPAASNREFAATYSSFVTYEQFRGANHVQSWNVDPGQYDGILTGFLRSHLNCVETRRHVICA